MLGRAPNLLSDESACQTEALGFDPGLGKNALREESNISVSWPGESLGRRPLEGYQSIEIRKELDTMTKQHTMLDFLTGILKPFCNVQYLTQKEKLCSAVFEVSENYI